MKNKILKNFFFNSEKSVLKIDDNLKWNYFLIRSAVGLTVINSVLFPLGSDEPLFSFRTLIWVILGIICLLLLLYSLIKKSTSAEIPLSEIEEFRQKVLLGRKRHSLLLKNGKKRDLYFKSSAEMAAIKDLLTTRDIPVR